jgi:alpha/beta superfamily hydrolase
MALRASLQTEVSRLVTVAPALRWLSELGERVPACPWLVVQGDLDQLVDAAAVQRWAAGLPVRPDVVLLPGAEHFFHGQLGELRAAVTKWLAQAA